MIFAKKYDLCACLHTTCACLSLSLWAALALLPFTQSSFAQSSSSKIADVPSNHVFEVYVRAKIAFDAKDYGQAATLFAEAESAHPGQTDSLVFEGKALVNVGDFAGADRALETHLTRNPQSAEALYLLGYVLQRENKPKESLESFTRAAALRPPQANDLKLVGLDYVLLDDYRDAIRWLTRAVEMDAHNSEAWYDLGRAQMNQGHFIEAEQAFKRVLELSPRDVKAENNLGLVYEAQNRTDDALKADEAAIAWESSSKNPSELPLLNYGTLLVTRNRWADAIAVLEPAIKLAPLNAACHEQLARAYLQAGNITGASIEMSRAAQIEPGNARYHYELGRIYRRAGLKNEAQQELDRSAALYGTKSTAQDK